MAVEAGAPSRVEVVVAGALVVPARLLLAGIVAVSFLVRLVVGLTHATPEYMPDEYIYSTLARSLALQGRPLIRGQLAHFPSLLEPLLAAPFWLIGGQHFAYRATLAENALFMSLAAIPIYLLARHLQLGEKTALACAAFTVTVQSLFFTTFVLADPVAYPLALTALYLGVKTLEQPTRRNQLSFLALCALAAFARIQYIALPAAYLTALLIQTRARPHQLARHKLTLTLLTLTTITAAAAGSHRLLGYYQTAAKLHHPTTALHWAATDTMLLGYATGIILIPAALTTLITELLKPQNPRTSAFATLTLTTTLALLTETSIYAANGSNRFQERYLITLLPLTPILYGLYQRRGRDERAPKILVAGTAVALLLLAVRVPLSGYTIADFKQDSPFLIGLFRLEQLTSIANGSLFVAIAASVLALCAVAIVVRPRLGAAGIPLAICFVAVFAIASWSFDARKASMTRSQLAPDVSWVDDAKLGNGAIMLETAGDPRWAPYQELFWNRSIDRLYLLGNGAPIDLFSSPGVRVVADGRMLLHGKAIRAPLLVPNYGTQTSFRGAAKLESQAHYTLWRPEGTPRLARIVEGLYEDKWLAGYGHLTVWPGASGRIAGTMRFVFWAPEGTWPSPLHLTAPGVSTRVTLVPGRRCVVVVPVAARGPWTLVFESRKPVSLPDGRIVSVQSAQPVLGPAGAATGTTCASGAAPLS
jgi:hypothetical protein